MTQGMFIGQRITVVVEFHPTIFIDRWAGRRVGGRIFCSMPVIDDGSLPVQDTVDINTPVLGWISSVGKKLW